MRLDDQQKRVFKSAHHCFNQQTLAEVVLNSWAVVSSQKCLPFQSLRWPQLKEGRLGQSQRRLARSNATIAAPSLTVIKFTPRARTWRLIWEFTLERDPTPAPGQTVVTPFLDRTSWRDTQENTPERVLSSAKFAVRALQDLIILPCTLEDIEPDLATEQILLLNNSKLNIFKWSYIGIRILKVMTCQAL